MADKLDMALAGLRASPMDRRLDDLSVHVWKKLDAQAEPAQSLWRWRTIALAAVMLCGAAVSAVAARTVHDTSPFSVRAALAPSTLLAEEG